MTRGLDMPPRTQSSQFLSRSSSASGMIPWSSIATGTGRTPIGHPVCRWKVECQGQAVFSQDDSPDEETYLERRGVRERLAEDTITLLAQELSKG